MYIYLTHFGLVAPSVANVQAAIEHIFPLVSEFKAGDKETDKNIVAQEMKFIKKQRGSIQPSKPVTRFEEYQEVEMYDTDCSDEEFDSDESQDWIKINLIGLWRWMLNSPLVCFSEWCLSGMYRFDSVYTYVFSPTKKRNLCSLIMNDPCKLWLSIHYKHRLFDIEYAMTIMIGVYESVINAQEMCLYW